MRGIVESNDLVRPDSAGGAERENACGDCGSGSAVGFDFTFAFQPIVNAAARTVFSYEALVRGPAQESAQSILARVNDGNRYRFDQACRVKALTLATKLGLEANLNINFLPNAVYRPENCIRTTLMAAKRLDFPIDRLIFEVTEDENIVDADHLSNIFREYKRLGFATAIDDFGSGYAGLNLLANYQPDYIKLDINLMRGIDREPTRQAIVRGIAAVCRDLSIKVVAEGVETEDEYAWLYRLGIDLFQGYLFARPGFEALPVPSIPVVSRKARPAARPSVKRARLLSA
jgi:EAL domain-containing protein (putative c-di-GMP-specific phosphodiesterase class I)